MTKCSGILMRRKKKTIAKRVAGIKSKYADHPYVNNMVNRVIADVQYHEIRIRFQNQVVCFYCGVRATGVDHQPPLSRIDEYRHICKSTGKPVLLLKVSCCAECNRLLGNSVFSSFLAKLENLRRRLAKKYAHITPEDKVQHGRLKRRLSFDRGINRIAGKYE
jgi:hypothetical protein